MHLRDTATLESVGIVGVSTIDLSTVGYGPGYETCLFHQRNGEAIWSEVTEWYACERDARQGHARWCEPENVAKLIHANRRHFTQDEVYTRCERRHGDSAQL